MGPQCTILLVFLATTVSLACSVHRDLAGSPQLTDAWQHMADYAHDKSNAQAMIRDIDVALSLIIRSELTVFLLVQWCFCAYAVLALLTVAMFLGRLSTREISRLSERLIKFIVFKVVFCGALIAPDIYVIVLWLAWFAMVGYMRIFMGAAKDRLESLVVSPSATTWAHVRTLALVVVILLHDAAGIYALLSNRGGMQMTKVLLCAFDMAIVLVEGTKTLLRYGVHLWDQHVASLSSRADDAPDTTTPGAGAAAAAESGLGWEAWEGKGALLYHTELVADVLVHAMTLAHYLHVWFLHGLSFQLIDAILFLDIRSIVLSMLKRLRGYLNYRHATHSLRHAFPDAVLHSTHELCSICMDRMGSAKQLPCGHLFHLACLRAWLQQSGTESFACPLCRTPLLREQHAAQQQQQQTQQQHQHQQAALQQQPHPHQGSGWQLLAACARLVSALYLDIFFGLLLGLPSSTARLRQHAMAAADRINESANALDARGRAPRRRDDQQERVGESDHPAPGQPPPAAAAAAAARRGGGSAAAAASRPPRSPRVGLLQTLLVLSWGEAMASVINAQQAREEAEAAARMAEASSELESDGSDEDLHDVAAEDDSFQGRLQRVYGARAGHASAARGHGYGGGEIEAAGDGSSDEADIAAELPRFPPPYPEPSTWSAGSLQAAGRYAARTIRSSLGMGVAGPGAVAGTEHEADQEAESAYRLRRRGKQQQQGNAGARARVDEPGPSSARRRGAVGAAYSQEGEDEAAEADEAGPSARPPGRGGQRRRTRAAAAAAGDEGRHL